MLADIFPRNQVSTLLYQLIFVKSINFYFIFGTSEDHLDSLSVFFFFFTLLFTDYLEGFQH